MKTTDLMIGDWVSCDGKNYQIAEIGGMVCLDAEKEIFASLEDIEPIPLTPEILEKNGFKNEGYFAKLVAGEYAVICDCSNVAVLQNDEMKMDIPIKYVHDLQHALKLCGIEKEIKI